MDRFVINFKNFEKSEALETYTKMKIERVLAKFIHLPRRLEIVFEFERHGHFRCTAILLGNGMDAHVVDSGRYLYDSVDRVCAKLSRFLRKEKLKAHDHSEERRFARIQQLAVSQ